MINRIGLGNLSNRINSIAASNPLYSTVSTYGLTTYINGDEDDLLENVGVGHEFDWSGASVETDVNYNVDDETVTPSVTLSFSF